MKVLLTGATGFIGFHVAAVLEQAGHEVTTLGRDLLSPGFRFPRSQFDICLHLAWYAEPGKYLDSPLNQQWVTASLRLAQEVNTQRFVAIGTCIERESTTLYAQCKLELFEKLQQLDTPVAWPRLFYQYGPREDPRRLVPYIIQSLLRGQPAELTPGEQVRDFLHVEDVARAIVAVAESNLTGAVNIGSGQPITVRALAGQIGAIIGRPELLKFGARPYAPGDPLPIVADNTRLLATGWRPRYNLDTGLRETINWWRQHLS